MGGQYGLKPLYVGLCFLPGGVGIIAGGFIAGRLLDHNFKHVARASGFPGDRRFLDITQFSVERARSRGSFVMVAVSLGAVVGYGWTLERHAHPAVVLVLQTYLGCKCTVIHQIYSALIVDVFPHQPGTAAASNNITRCTLAAVAVAVLDPLVKGTGYGWVFTFFGLLEAVGCLLAVFAVRRWGQGWRRRRLPAETNMDS
jgi:predicted MFS family arabinose efflux permease